MTDAKLSKIIDEPLSLEDIPWHNQSIERCVNLVSKASSDRIGHTNRHQSILNLVKSRSQMTIFET